MLTFVIYFTLQKSESTQKSQSTLSYPQKYSNQEGMGLSCILSHKDEINVFLSWIGFNILVSHEILIFHSSI